MIIVDACLFSQIVNHHVLSRSLGVTVKDDTSAIRDYVVAVKIDTDDILARVKSISAQRGRRPWTKKPRPMDRRPDGIELLCRDHVTGNHLGPG